MSFLKYFISLSVGIFFVLAALPIPVFAINTVECSSNCTTTEYGLTTINFPTKDPKKPAIGVKVSIPGVTHTFIDKTVTPNKRYYFVNDLQDFLASMYKFLVGIAGILAVIMMMVGGYYWLFAGGNTGMVQKGKELITNSTLGLFLAVGSYTLLIFINPDLVNLKPLDIKTPNLAKVSAVTKICSETIENTLRSNGNPTNFGCGRVHYPNLKQYEVNCGGTVKSEECKGYQAVAFANGCMGVICPSSPVSKICSIQSDNDGNLVSGGCVSSINARTTGTNVVTFVVDPDNGQICGGANLTLTDEVDPQCNDGAGTTSCTLISEPDTQLFYKPALPLQYVAGWGGRIVGSYKGAEFSMWCRYNFPASMIYS
ncbi:MAG TPA: pilin, partial [Patescibacteria group bacterium]|nr:pilin [Patescibacteria group bacterium]